MKPDTNAQSPDPEEAPEETTPHPLDLQIEEWFTYHPPVGDQVPRYEHLRIGGRQFAQMIADLVPPGPDRTAAIRKVREAVMTANAGIACKTIQHYRSVGVEISTAPTESPSMTPLLEAN